jgi:hypothetical protein
VIVDIITYERSTLMNSEKYIGLAITLIIQNVIEKTICAGLPEAALGTNRAAFRQARRGCGRSPAILFFTRP